ncbi:sensor histidine kinase [Kordiimonas sp.]|uniref:sensor histidine kinase n=1 Tax=Kordiimonas sp. TaxID=1970157 RepID=UPI003A8D2216
MKPSPRRVRSMIMRTFVSALISSFVIFTFMVVIFGFELEDNIFDTQVKNATARFLSDNPELPVPYGTLTGVDMTYYVGTDAMPDWLAAKVDPTYTNGAFEVFGKEYGHFHALVRPLQDGRKLYVFFNARPFVRSTPQIKGFLLVICGMAGIVLLLSLFFLARMSRKVSRPLEDIADLLAAGDSVEGRLILPAQAPQELHALVEAIETRDRRIQALLERERQFNRDASHELRTPLAVAFGAAEVLEERQASSAALTRLKSAIKDMQQLTEGILWLGRDPGEAQHCNVTDVCRDSIKAYHHLVGKRDVAINMSGDDSVAMPVPEPVAHVMVGNILRNALSYTDSGSVSVSVGVAQIEILDTGVGFGDVDAERRGFGLGLTLVTRLCSHFGISFEVSARQDGGTRAVLSWGDRI